ncbi:LysE family translocator, partial [Undibacterium luofuense]|uniref:LysE family translocator n=1 Tax=Undibacterium luofuense TaxID=2828733 RepID=UPI0030EE379E
FGSIAWFAATAGQFLRKSARAQIALTRVKVVLFFLAFLPQFVSAERGPLAPQFIQLGALFIIATLIAFGSIAWFAATAGQFLRKSARAQIALNRVAATVFAGLAVKLAMAQR